MQKKVETVARGKKRLLLLDLGLGKHGHKIDGTRYSVGTAYQILFFLQQKSLFLIPLKDRNVTQGVYIEPKRMLHR